MLFSFNLLRLREKCLNIIILQSCTLVVAKFPVLSFYVERFSEGLFRKNLRDTGSNNALVFRYSIQRFSCALLRLIISSKFFFRKTSLGHRNQFFCFWERDPKWHLNSLVSWENLSTKATIRGKGPAKRANIATYVSLSRRHYQWNPYLGRSPTILQKLCSWRNLANERIFSDDIFLRR